MGENSGQGSLKVQAIAADGAFPVEGATVFISDGVTGEFIASLRTDSSGFTEKISLPAPSRELSQSPDNVLPYSTYTVQVIKEGYNGVSDLTVPIFDGITAIQKANLIPLSIFPQSLPGELIVETPGYPDLRASDIGRSL
ncbi:MAG: hypothetical protein IJA52_02605 [Clostridia bacterium]|nr:hypothetical protein [Clostridia bacterium]